MGASTARGDRLGTGMHGRLKEEGSLLARRVSLTHSGLTILVTICMSSLAYLLANPSIVRDVDIGYAEL